MGWGIGCEKRVLSSSVHIAFPIYPSFLYSSLPFFFSFYLCPFSSLKIKNHLGEGIVSCVAVPLVATSLATIENYTYTKLTERRFVYAFYEINSRAYNHLAIFSMFSQGSHISIDIFLLVDHAIIITPARRCQVPLMHLGREGQH